jgi:hypothetical protein
MIMMIIIVIDSHYYSFSAVSLAVKDYGLLTKYFQLRMFHTRALNANSICTKTPTHARM